jgi:hypothetical protein
MSEPPITTNLEGARARRTKRTMASLKFILIHTIIPGIQLPGRKAGRYPAYTQIIES